MEKLELEYTSTLEQHLKSQLIVAHFVGLYLGLPLLKKVGYVGWIFNCWLFYLVYFSKEESPLRVHFFGIWISFQFVFNFL